MAETYELEPDRVLPIVAEYHAADATVRLLQEVEASSPWIVCWTDGINEWFEFYSEPEYAFARMTTLIRCIERQVFLVHDGVTTPDREVFAECVELFLNRTVHT